MWIRKLSDPPGVVGLERWRVRRGEELFRHKSATTNLFSVRLRVVCKRCNNEWMSTLEKATIPVLSRLVRGLETDLTPNHQHQLAAWATKTAMVLEFLDVPKGKESTFVTDEVRSSFRLDRTPLPHSQIWLATYESDKPVEPFRSERHEVSGPRHASSKDYLLLTTFVVGRAVFRVAFKGDPKDVGEFTVSKSVKDVSGEIWPVVDLWRWPPPIALDSHSLRAFGSIKTTR